MTLKIGKRCAWAGVITSLVSLAPAHAALQLTPFISAKVEQDNNVFRLRDDAEALAERGDPERSDLVQTYRAGVESAYTAGLQKLSLNASTQKVEYSEFADIDYDGHDVMGKLDWQLGSRLKGEVGVEDSRRLESFSSVSAAERSLRDTSTAKVGATLKLLADYELQPRINAKRIRNSLETSKQQDRDEESAALALKYVGRAGISLGMEVVLGRGEFVKRTTGEGVIEEFDQTTVQLVGSWTPSVITSVNLELGSTRRNNKGINVEDDDGIIGSLFTTRNISPKTYVYGGFYRSIYSAEIQGESTVVSTGWNVGANWNATSRIVVNGSVLYGKDDFQSSGATGSDRKDNLKSATVSLAYTPREWLVLTPALGWEDRSSDLDSAEYDDFRASFEVQLRYPLLR